MKTKQARVRVSKLNGDIHQMMINDEAVSPNTEMEDYRHVRLTGERGGSFVMPLSIYKVVISLAKACKDYVVEYNVRIRDDDHVETRSDSPLGFNALGANHYRIPKGMIEFIYRPRTPVVDQEDESDEESPTLQDFGGFCRDLARKSKWRMKGFRIQHLRGMVEDAEEASRFDSEYLRMKQEIASLEADLREVGIDPKTVYDDEYY